MTTNLYADILKTEVYCCDEPEPIVEFSSHADFERWVSQRKPVGHVPNVLRYTPHQAEYLDDMEEHFLDFFLDIKDEFSWVGFLCPANAYVTFIDTVVLPSIVPRPLNASLECEDHFSGEE